MHKPVGLVLGLSVWVQFLARTHASITLATVPAQTCRPDARSVGLGPIPGKTHTSITLATIPAQACRPDARSVGLGPIPGKNTRKHNPGHSSCTGMSAGC